MWLNKLASSLSVVLILVALLITLEKPRRSSAQAPLIPDFRQFDFDSDGKPDQAVIECACVTANDRILVFDGGGDMRSSADWKEGTDIANDYWVFDVGARGFANLIIRFHSSDGEQVARLYDDTDGDGVVAYHIDGKQVVIDESPFWSLEITSRPGWIDENGRSHLSIRALMDKPFPAGFEFLDGQLAQEYMPHDGRPDVEFELVDEDQDGVAEYFLSKLISDGQRISGIGKSRLWFNAGKIPSQRSDSAWFWPFLDFQTIDRTEDDPLRFFDQLPHVSIDWQQSSILGFVLPGYPVEEGYWINSQTMIKNGQINDLSYEAPHAWYDLAGDQDGSPELNIRLFKPVEQQHYEIRYSWNQSNSSGLVWDYKLGLMGSLPIDEIVDFHTFSLRMIPYERLPNWVFAQEWELTTFVAREGDPRESSEGIYAWSPWNGADPISPDNPSLEAQNAALSYVTGASLIPPNEYFNDIWEGFRGEYNLAHPLKPELYFSPIDHRLHLKGGLQGLLNLGDMHYVQYENSDGDDYFDAWKSVVAGKIRRQLFVAKPYLLYAGEDEIIIKNAYFVDALFETQPPQNHTEWLQLGQYLEDYQREFAADDFKGMVQQLDGSETHIEGTALKNFRQTQDGFRIVLELLPGFRVSGLEARSWNPLQPGTYVFTYSDSMGGSIHVDPMRPPELDVSLMDANLTQLEQSTTHVAIRNDGLEDLPEATLELWATSPDGFTSSVVTQTVTLLAQSAITTSVVWAPPTDGQWTLTPSIRLAEKSFLTGNPVRVTVLPGHIADLPGLIPVTAPQNYLPLVVLALLLFAGTAAYVFVKGMERPS